MSFWDDDAGFDLDHHVVHVALPGQGRQARAADARSRLASTPLKPARPLWQFHLVDNYAGGSALVVRIHHCYADGIALVQVMLSMTDAAPNGPPAMPAPAPESARRAPARPATISTLLMQPFAGAMQTAMKIGATLVEKGVAIWQDPAKAVALAEQGGALTAEIARLALMQAGLADAVQGQARRSPSASRGPTRCRCPRSRRSARRSAPRSTTCCCPASPARCASTWSRRATRSTA